MKTIALLLLSVTCFAQFKDAKLPEPKQDSVMVISLTALQDSKLVEIDKKIQELQIKQKELLEFIFDANNVDINRVKSLKYENKKLVYTYE